MVRLVASVAGVALGIALGMLVAPLAALGAEMAAASAPAQTQQELPASAPAAVIAPNGASAPAAAPPLVLPAASAPVPASAPASTWIPTIPPIPALNALNAPHDYLAKEFMDFVNGIDSFFGNDRNYQEANNSVFQLYVTRIMGYTGAHQFVLQGKANVDLPRTEKRLHLLIESDPDKNTANASNQVQVNQPSATTTKPASYGAGLRYNLKSDDDRWHLATDGGIKFAGLSTAPFARVRGSYGIPLDQWRLKAAETVFWFNTTGAGETTQVDFERTLSDPELFRASTSATWLNDQQSFDLRQDFSLFQTVDDTTRMLYQAAVIGVSDADLQAHVTDYVLLMLYRHRLHREWMYLEISPQLHFPQERNFMHSGMLSVRLEILFDKSR